MDSFKPGELAVFGEDGGRKLVRIVENRSTAEKNEYRLRVIENIRNTSLNPKIPIGEEFDVMQLTTGAWGGMWDLERVEEYRERHPEWAPPQELAA